MIFVIRYVWFITGNGGLQYREVTYTNIQALLYYISQIRLYKPVQDRQILAYMARGYYIQVKKRNTGSSGLYIQVVIHKEVTIKAGFNYNNKRYFS